MLYPKVKIIACGGARDALRRDVANSVISSDGMAHLRRLMFMRQRKHTLPDKQEMTMQKRSIFTAITLATLVAATLSTSASAERLGGGMMGGMDGGMMGGMDGGPMMDFATLDADKDGKVTQDEMTAFHTAKVTAADADKDGKLSADELAAMQMTAMQARAANRAAMMVERMDSDGDGLISAAEMAAGPNRADIFARMDADGDGAVTQAEVDAAKAKMQGMMGGRGHGKHGGKGHGWFGMGQDDADDATGNN